MSIVIAELEKLTKLIKDEDESEPEYWVRLVSSADTIINDNEELWQGLNILTQSWMNKVIKAILEGSAVLPALPEDKKRIKAVVSEKIEAPKSPDPTSGVSLSEKVPPTPTPEPQPVKFSPPGKPSALKRTWMLMIEDSTRSIGDLMKLLEDEGYVANKSTIASKRSDVLYLLQLLKEMGRI